jgi:hypothetical protein
LFPQHGRIVSGVWRGVGRQKQQRGYFGFHWLGIGVAAASSPVRDQVVIQRSILSYDLSSFCMNFPIGLDQWFGPVTGTGLNDTATAHLVE